MFPHTLATFSVHTNHWRMLNTDDMVLIYRECVRFVSQTIICPCYLTFYRMKSIRSVGRVHFRKCTSVVSKHLDIVSIFFSVYFGPVFMVFFLHTTNVFVHKMKSESPELKKVVTLSKISLRSMSRFFILLAQNDRPVRSFRLRGRSTSS